MIIFGLGNPGIKYRATRHNAGYLLLDRFTKLYKKRFHLQKRFKMATVEINSTVIKLIKPQCWMNQSGTVISNILQKQREAFLVVVDDINLPLGKIRLRNKGSDGGHLGMRSIINTVGSSNFPRLRIGIGPPDGDVISFVLKPFKRKEKKILNTAIEEGIKGIEKMFKENFMKAQSYINSIHIEFDSNR